MSDNWSQRQRPRKAAFRDASFRSRPSEKRSFPATRRMSARAAALMLRTCRTRTRGDNGRTGAPAGTPTAAGCRSMPLEAGRPQVAASSTHGKRPEAVVSAPVSNRNQTAGRDCCLQRASGITAGVECPIDHSVLARNAHRHAQKLAPSTRPCPRDVVADSTRPRMLIKSGLPVRWYLPREDVRMDCWSRATPPHAAPCCATLAHVRPIPARSRLRSTAGRRRTRSRPASAPLMRSRVS